MSKQRAKGTAGERGVVNFINAQALDNGYGGILTVERRALNGTQDRGDIAGIPGVVIEVKNCAKMELAQWVDEANVEADNDGANIGVVWHKRKGKGSAGEWYVTMDGAQFAWLLGFYLDNLGRS